MKRSLLILTVCFLALKSFGQYNYYRFSVGANAGLTQAYADLGKLRINQGLAATLDYHITPFVSAGLEIQKGTVSGGDSILDPHQRFFKNGYTAIIVSGKAQLGQFVDFESSNFLYAIRGLYIGTGIGRISNNLKEIARVQPGTGYVFPGKDKSSGLIIPINTGININILDRWGYTRYIFNVNYQMNVTTGEGLDGYGDASDKMKNQFPDFYSFASVGIKFCFGPEGLY